MDLANQRVILFYKFIHLDDPVGVAEEQRAQCQALGLRGRILLAEEGINGTLEGSIGAIEEYKRQMSQSELFGDMAFKESVGTGQAFTKLKVKVRPEVVTLGAGKFDIASETASELSADELADWYARGEDFVVLDLRNDFEVKAGRFEQTVDPELRHFRDLPAKLPALAHLKHKKVVAVCTGGIRCEKATCLLKREGFNQLYQLKDGIHTYLAKYPGKRGKFKGSLFVFDNRLTTAVVEGVEREVIGTCEYCGQNCETFYNDDTVRPSRKVICCNICLTKHVNELREAYSLI